MPLKCVYCGKQITGRYFTDYWGNAYCAAHSNAPQCHYCGRLIGKESSRGGKSYSDGRNICGVCLQTAVTDQKVGLELLNRVHDLLEMEGIEIKPFKPEFILLDRLKNRKISADTTERQGFAKYDRQVSPSGDVLEFDLQVFIITGLPEASFISTCAHELMHIWFYSRNITDTSPALTEGSCNMASYLVLKRINTPESALIIKNLFESKDRVYGGGFRKVHRLTDRKGIEGWLKYAKTHKRI